MPKLHEEIGISAERNDEIEKIVNVLQTEHAKDHDGKVCIGTFINELCHCGNLTPCEAAYAAYVLGRAVEAADRHGGIIILSAS